MFRFMNFSGLAVWPGTYTLVPASLLLESELLTLPESELDSESTAFVLDGRGPKQVQKKMFFFVGKILFFF